MSYLLIIGNGFDKTAGLKSSYQDYFESEYYKKTFESVKSYVERVDNYIGFDLTAYDEFNCWDLLFYLKTYYTSTKPPKAGSIKWCDIEEVIHDSLYSHDAQLFNWNNIFDIVYRYYNSKNRDSIQGSINRKSLDNRVIIEYVKRKFGRELNNATDSYNQQFFYKWLLKELSLFEKKFGKYIEEQQKNVDYKRKAKDLIWKLGGNNGDYEMDSFNYSAFTTDENKKINHINGDTASPIFGISNTVSGLDNDSNTILFTKTQRRINQDTSNILPYESRENTTHAVVFGHSLNRQDYDYFSYIFTLLKYNTLDTNKMGIVEFKFYVYDESRRAEICSRLSKSIQNLIEYYEKNVCGRDSSVLTNLLRFSGKLRISEVIL